MALSNEEVFDMKPWSDNLFMCSPISPDQWPERRRAPPASGLTFSEYFTECDDIPSADLAAFNDFIKMIPDPDFDTSVYCALLSTYSEITKCKEMLIQEHG